MLKRDGVTLAETAFNVCSWHEAADCGAATSRQILRVERTCHGRFGTAEFICFCHSTINFAALHGTALAQRCHNVRLPPEERSP